MTVELIQKLGIMIESMNPKQQIIANRIKLNKNYRIFESVINNETEVFFQDLSTKEVFNLVNYVKANCGCD